MSRDSLSEPGREEDGYREDLSSLDVKSETETIRAESPDSTKGDGSKCMHIIYCESTLFYIDFIITRIYLINNV